MLKIIWIDLDEVLAETMDQILEDNNYKLWWKSISREDIRDYYIYNNKHIWIELEEAIKIFHWVYVKDINFDIKVVSGEKEKLIEFKDKWHNLKIITGRPECIEYYTINWVEKHFPWFFQSIHFANHFTYSSKQRIKKPKSEICRELWIEVMVEDLFEYALELAENWIYTYLLEKPWNKHISQQHPNIKKVKHWSEINI